MLAIRRLLLACYFIKFLSPKITSVVFCETFFCEICIPVVFYSLFVVFLVLLQHFFLCVWPLRDHHSSHFVEKTGRNWFWTELLLFIEIPQSSLALNKTFSASVLFLTAVPNTKTAGLVFNSSKFSLIWGEEIWAEGWRLTAGEVRRVVRVGQEQVVGLGHPEVHHLGCVLQSPHRILVHHILQTHVVHLIFATNKETQVR